MPNVVLLSPGLYLAGGLLAVLLAGRPARARLAAGILACAAAGAGVASALPALLGGPAVDLRLFQPTPFTTFTLRLDATAAWFVLLLSLVAFAASLGGLGYARAYDHHGGPRLAAATCLFLAAMALVLLAADLFGFLLTWELMSLASYLLVTQHDEDPAVRQAGFVYLVMTHLGTAFLMAALLVLGGAAGSLEFAAMRQATGALDPRLRDLVFLLGLVGFSTKAGLVPLHVWLPRAHPVAPSHISALMSGVMLKTAVYGLARLSFDLLGGGPAWWGGLLLALGLVSAVLGVLYALMEHDLKRLLAFHSVENVGIVAIGLGAALLFAALGLPAAAALALAAGLFHALNHALFKALLFLGAGAIHQATGTKDLERLGGLVRRMPQTAGLFLVGAVAIAALPPLNGFASEWLTFQSLLALAPALPAGWGPLAAAGAAALLALTGALAAACFVKVFGIAFLALPRSAEAAAAAEAPAALRAGMLALALACLALGLAPAVALRLLAPVALGLVGAAPASPDPITLAGLGTPEAGRAAPSLALGALLALAGAVVLGLRLLGPARTRRAPTWVCGFALEPAMQYGSVAFAKPIRLFFRGIVRPARVVTTDYAQPPYFPRRLHYHGGVHPVFERHLYSPLALGLLHLARQVRAIQNGSVRLYLAYVFATLIALLLLLR